MPSRWQSAPGIVDVPRAPVDSTGMMYTHHSVAAVLEALEDRRLMSASIGVVKGVLTIAADPVASTSIDVDLSDNGQGIDVSVGDVTQTVAIAGIRKIRITGSNL